MEARHVTTRGGELQRGAYHLCYWCDNNGDSEAPDCPIWLPDHKTVAITLLVAPSGTGKTSLLHQLHDEIEMAKGSTQSFPSKLHFEFSPKIVPEQVSVGIVPQNPPIVRHWKVSDLVQHDSPFLECLFVNMPLATKDLRKRHMNELSGGQQKKVYTASVLDQLAQESAANVFLLMDETFDGLGCAEAKRGLQSIADTWKENFSNRALNLLMVTHLGTSEFSNLSPHCTRVSLDVTEEFETHTKVRISHARA